MQIPRLSGHLVNLTCMGLAVRDVRGSESTLKEEHGSCGSYSGLGYSTQAAFLTLAVPATGEALRQFQGGHCKAQGPTCPG